MAPGASARRCGLGAEDEESLRSLRAAYDAGVNFYDTALVYGDGHSERLIAQCFGDASDIIIASKVPPKDYVWAQKPVLAWTRCSTGSTCWNVSTRR